MCKEGWGLAQLFFVLRVLKVCKVRIGISETEMFDFKVLSAFVKCKKDKYQKYVERTVHKKNLNIKIRSATFSKKLMTHIMLSNNN